MLFDLRENVYAIGDMHGNLKALMHALSVSTSKEYLPDGSDVILLGDCGMVNSGVPNDYRAANKKAKKRDIRIFIMRGNHDNPDIYKHTWHDEDPQLSNVYLLEDLDEFRFTNGKLGVVIPGAVSTDRYYRWVNNWCWFENEGIPSIDSLEDPEKYSFIFSHGGPTPPVIERSDNPLFASWCAADENLLPDLEKEQGKWRDILSKVKPDRMYYGHYHCSERFEVNNTECKVCDIGEIIEVNYA